MTYEEADRKYNLQDFTVAEDYELGTFAGGPLTDRELCRAVYGTDNEELLDMWMLDMRKDNFYKVAARDYGHRYLRGMVIQYMENSEKNGLWHIEDTLKMTRKDPGLSFNLYFEYMPNEYQIIEEICRTHGITADTKIETREEENMYV